MYLVQPDEVLDQGDIIKKVVILAPASNEPTCALEPMLARVIVLSHGCEIDKADSSTLLVAPVVRLSVDDRGLTGLIRKGRVRNCFHLAAGCRVSGPHGGPACRIKPTVLAPFSLAVISTTPDSGAILPTSWSVLSIQFPRILSRSSQS